MTISEIIVNIIFAFIYIGAFAFGIFLVKSYLDYGAPIVSITYNAKKWEQEKRIIEYLDMTENFRLQQEAMWHNLSETPVDHDAHKRYLKNRAYHFYLMDMYGKTYSLK